MRDCDSISWIGEEKIHLEIRSRRRENKGSHRCVSVRGIHREVSDCMNLSTQVFHTYTWFTEEKFMYIHIS
jgi:hypothetical protein